MTLKHHIVCNGCDKEIMTDEAPHSTRLEFERGGIEHSERNPTALVPYTKTMPRRDLCETCMLRVRQALAVLPKFAWLLDGFEVQK